VERRFCTAKLLVCEPLLALNVRCDDEPTDKTLEDGLERASKGLLGQRMYAPPDRDPVALRYLLSAACAVIAIPVIGSNDAAAFKSLVLRRPAPSWIPLIGGLSGLGALVFFPANLAHRLWWIPLVLDWGSVPGMVHAALAWLLRKGVKPE
jgi:hypothetical protein